MTFRVPVGYNPHDLPGQIVDEGQLGRIVDPISGASWLNPNSDPNEVGIDPITGEDYVAGTDQGFGLMAYDALVTGLYNAQFSVGPPEGDGSQIEEQYNEVPYWRYVQDDSGHVRARWEWNYSSPGGYTITWVVTDAEVGDTAYFEQIVPISANAWRTAVPVLVCDYGAYGGIYLEAQTLDAYGTELGTALYAVQGDAPFGTDYRLTGPVAVESNARYLRVRIGYVSDGNDNIVAMHEVYAGRPRLIHATASFSSTYVDPGTTHAIYSVSGNNVGTLDQTANRYIPPFGGWVEAISVRGHAAPTSGYCTFRVWSETDSRAIGPMAVYSSGLQASASQGYAAANGYSPATGNPTYLNYFHADDVLRVVAEATSGFSNASLDSLIHVTFALIDARE